MDPLRGHDTTFASALQSLVDRPGIFERVLELEGVNGTHSRTYDTLRVVIERTVRRRPNMFHKATLSLFDRSQLLQI